MVRLIGPVRQGRKSPAGRGQRSDRHDKTAQGGMVRSGCCRIWLHAGSLEAFNSTSGTRGRMAWPNWHQPSSRRRGTPAPHVPFPLAREPACGHGSAPPWCPCQRPWDGIPCTSSSQRCRCCAPPDREQRPSGTSTTSVRRQNHRFRQTLGKAGRSMRIRQLSVALTHSSPSLSYSCGHSWLAPLTPA